MMDPFHKNSRWVSADEVELEPCGQGVARRIMAYSDDAMCVVNHFEKGGIGAMHSHPHTQITYVAAGRFRFTIGDEVREVKTGDTLLKTDGVVHGCECLESGILVDFFTPMRRDFREK